MIQIKNLSKIKNGRTILNLSQINIAAGEIVSLVGTADSGLETLLNLLIGKEAPSAGEITLNGFIPGQDKNKLNEKIGVLFQENGLYLNQSVEKNLKFFARLYNLPNKQVSEALRDIGLADQANERVNLLSPALKRRLAFGRCLLHRPPILILEQPFESCDEASLEFIKMLIHREAKQGAAILILNKDSSQLENLCTRIYFIKGGQIEQVLEGGQAQPADMPFKIPVKLEGKVALLNPGDILYAEASQGHTLLMTKESHLTSQYTLQELEERLKRAGFFRAHRSYLVNLQHVQEVIPYSRNSFSLRLNDNNHTEIPLSKNSAAELRDLLNY